MNKPNAKPRPPARIHWLLGWMGIFFGLCFLLGGSLLIPSEGYSILGAALVMVGGIGVGAGGRVLLVCRRALLRSRDA